jgi:hypothetical protein
MIDRLVSSLERAINILHTPPNYEDYVCIKIAPEKSGCCCFHCWPYTWSTVNRYLLQLHEKQLEDEGEVVIGNEGDRFVLECHESGPEVVLYIGLATASLVFTKSVVDLITTLIKALQKEDRRRPGKVILTARQIKDGNHTEEQIMQIELPLDESVQKELNERIEELIRRRKWGSL